MFERYRREHKFTWANGDTDSAAIELGGGCFGTLLVPSGSALIGKTLQFVAVSDGSSAHADTPLLSTAKTLAAGANALSADEIAEVGAIGRCILRLSSAVNAASFATLLWKS